MFLRSAARRRGGRRCAGARLGVLVVLCGLLERRQRLPLGGEVAALLRLLQLIERGLNVRDSLVERGTGTGDRRPWVRLGRWRCRRRGGWYRRFRWRCRRLVRA